MVYLVESKHKTFISNDLSCLERNFKQNCKDISKTFAELKCMLQGFKNMFYLKS